MTTLPPLAEFLRWLAVIPDAFWAEPDGFAKGEVPPEKPAADEGRISPQPVEVYEVELACQRGEAATESERILQRRSRTARPKDRGVRESADLRMDRSARV